MTRRLSDPEGLRARHRREFFADLVTGNAGINDDAIRSAFASVDRVRFLGDGPWKVYTRGGYRETPVSDPDLVYQDAPVAIDAARTINNGQPSLHARCLHEARIGGGDTIIHVGTGTGYYTAVLAALTGADGRVIGFEIERDLALRAQENLAGVPQVEVRIASAVTEDLPAADVVYVCAGVTHPPREWLRALKIGGRMVFPLTGIEGSGVMMVVTREAAQGFAARSICGAAFIACADATSPEEARAVSEALARSRAKSVRTLVLDAMPDATAWLAGDGWFFSTADQATRKVPFASPS